MARKEKVDSIVDAAEAAPSTEAEASPASAPVVAAEVLSSTDESPLEAYAKSKGFTSLAAMEAAALSSMKAAPKPFVQHVAKWFKVKEDILLAAKGQTIKLAKGKILSTATHGSKIMGDIMRTRADHLEEVSAPKY